MNAAIALTVVAAVRAVGSVLVIAFVVTPAAAARLVTRSVAMAAVVGAALAVGVGWLALSISYEASVYHDVRLAAGATVVVAFEVAFAAIAVVVAVRRRWATRTPAT
jgi:manganese/iron transport system permease protein